MATPSGQEQPQTSSPRAAEAPIADSALRLKSGVTFSEDPLDKGDAAKAAADAEETSPSQSASIRKRVTMMSLGESAAGSGTFSSFNSTDFHHSDTSKMFGLPSKFFQSRASIRQWGAENIVDPMVQPYEDALNLPKPFHVSLPGYDKRLCKYVIDKGVRTARDPLLGPEISIFPPMWLPTWRTDPNFKPQAYNFNWQDNGTFQMERLPYANAVFEPTDGSQHYMYSQACPFTAYPYGVPSV